MRKYIPLFYVLIMICLFIFVPVFVLLILHYFNVDIRLSENFFLVIIYAMPILGVIAYIRNNTSIEVDSIEKTIINKVADPRRDWNWSRSIEELIRVELINSKEESKRVLGQKIIFSKMLVFTFQNQEVKYISASLFSKKQLNSIISFISSKMKQSSI